MNFPIRLIILLLFCSFLTACGSPEKKNPANKDTVADKTATDSSTLDSFGGDGTAKSRIGTTKDSTVMGTPPEPQQ